MRVLIIAAAALALVLPEAARSKDAPPSADRGTRLILAVFAGCVVKKRPQTARDIVLQDWDATRIVDKLRDTHTECAPRGLQLRFHAPVFKALMAAQLADTDLVPADAPVVAAAPPLTYTMPEPVKTVDAKGRPLPQRRIEVQQNAIRQKLHAVVISQFGECVARANPAAVPPLLKSIYGSKDEVAALKPFGPYLENCLPKGVTLELDRATIRNTISLAYYRLAMAARQSRAPGAAQ